jgi:membrane protein YdbS with pleckstrin-like domain
MTRTDSDVLFAGPHVEWQQISPQWRKVGWISAAIGSIPTALALAIAIQVIWGRWELTVIPLAAFAALWAWNAWLVWRRWPAWGYAETEDELWVRHGVMFRSLTVVPYGRLQVVDVNAGPLQRAFGLASVTLVTASADTDAHIPGLPYAEATRLRDRLTTRVDPSGSGL